MIPVSLNSASSSNFRAIPSNHREALRRRLRIIQLDRIRRQGLPLAKAFNQEL
jgi:hypothetical protein